MGSSGQLYKKWQVESGKQAPPTPAAGIEPSGCLRCAGAVEVQSAGGRCSTPFTPTSSTGPATIRSPPRWRSQPGFDLWVTLDGMM